MQVTHAGSLLRGKLIAPLVLKNTSSSFSLPCFTFPGDRNLVRRIQEHTRLVSHYRSSTRPASAKSSQVSQALYRPPLRLAIFVSALSGLDVTVWHLSDLGTLKRTSQAPQTHAACAQPRSQESGTVQNQPAEVKDRADKIIVYAALPSKWWLE